MTQKKFFYKIISVIILDIKFELGDLKFIWDSEKAEINWQKHKVRFETAVEVFLDENYIEDYDETHSDEEHRYKIIGLVEKVLVVIYTERDDRNRIISARLADKKKGEIIMNNIVFKNGVKIVRTPEQIAEIEAWKNMTDDDIDYSDIPPTSKEQLERMKANRLRRKKMQKTA